MPEDLNRIRGYEASADRDTGADNSGSRGRSSHKHGKNPARSVCFPYRALVQIADARLVVTRQLSQSKDDPGTERTDLLP
jgi:hypothetical protein